MINQKRPISASSNLPPSRLRRRRSAFIIFTIRLIYSKMSTERSTLCWLLIELKLLFPNKAPMPLGYFLKWGTSVLNKVHIKEQRAKLNQSEISFQASTRVFKSCTFIFAICTLLFSLAYSGGSFLELSRSSIQLFRSLINRLEHLSEQYFLFPILS